MADSRRFGLTHQLDIDKILLEAKSRWLRPAEICEILRNNKRFHIASESPNKPSSGSLFLFDRKVLRYFRKDGHNWRKKEAHERLKSGSVDVLHCYYAHGEENENFQRRAYWMLEEDLMRIVLVHYLEVKGSRSNFCRTRDVKDVPQVPIVNSPAVSNSITTQSQQPSQVTDDESPGHTSEYEDAESADNYQRSSRYHPHFEMWQYDDGSMMGAQLSDPFAPLTSTASQSDMQETQLTQVASDFYSVSHEDVTRVFDENGLNSSFNASNSQFDLPSWDEILQHCSTGFQVPYFQPPIAPTEAATIEGSPGFELYVHDAIYATDSNSKHVDANSNESESAWQTDMNGSSTIASCSYVENNISLDDIIANTPIVKQHSADEYGVIEGEGLKKYDSFSRWMSNELEEVDDSNIKSSSGIDWNDINSEKIVDPTISIVGQLDPYLLGPSLSQDQLYSIIDFSPTWAYACLGAKVLVIGTFLKNKELNKCKWACMFGEIEVPADVLADGTLRCHAPPHRAGKFPFYITCSNRLASSEVREFEFRESDAVNKETPELYNGSVDEKFLIHLDKLLSLEPKIHGKQDLNIPPEKAHLINKINSAMVEADFEWSNLLKLAQEEFSPETAKDRMLGVLLREKLHSWLLHKLAEDEKGASVLNKEGLGVLHLAAALGYDWAIKPTVVAGVNINFRDARGWTALHWAASCGRERTVVALVAMDAAPGALTHPNLEHPSGRTPADLASANGHKGIAGFLAESSLTSHLSALTLTESGESTMLEPLDLAGAEIIPEQSDMGIADDDIDIHAGLSLKDSLSALRNASQAAARIYQMYRIHSFHRKKLKDYGNIKHGMSNEVALSLVSVKSAKPSLQHMPLHSAAIRIQNKFRGWKGRKEFLIVRQRIIRIQAHVRGHQVRKHYRKILWSVGIVEKAILRWRRKGAGLRRFRTEDHLEGQAVQTASSIEDDYDFLRDGRKQTEARLQKALGRVKSMVQYPEARDQYRRLLTIVAELQESKAIQESAMIEEEDFRDEDLMLELQELCEDESFLLSA